MVENKEVDLNKLSKTDWDRVHTYWDNKMDKENKKLRESLLK